MHTLFGQDTYILLVCPVWRRRSERGSIDMDLHIITSGDEINPSTLVLVYTVARKNKTKGYE